MPYVEDGRKLRQRIKLVDALDLPIDGGCAWADVVPYPDVVAHASWRGAFFEYVSTISDGEHFTVAVGAPNDSRHRPAERRAGTGEPVWVYRQLDAFEPGDEAVLVVPRLAHREYLRD